MCNARKQQQQEKMAANKIWSDKKSLKSKKKKN